jgi:hypothetical protein
MVIEGWMLLRVRLSARLCKNRSGATHGQVCLGFRKAESRVFWRGRGLRWVAVQLESVVAERLVVVLVVVVVVVEGQVQQHSMWKLSMEKTAKMMVEIRLFLGMRRGGMIKDTATRCSRCARGECRVQG